MSPSAIGVAMRRRKLTVGDLFCGAGGFSEGFRQAGYKISWALDNWRAARTTYQKNMPLVEILEDDVSDIDFHKLPRVDVLIGGPPCTFFSLANKAGNGHVEQGLQLVQRFAEAVEILRPRYWIMENVPQLRSVLASCRVNRRKLNRISKCFPQWAILNAADFAIPQKRRRLFYGHFPVPSDYKAGEGNWIPMRKVIDALPYPLLDNVPDDDVSDPSYPEMRISASHLTDHFMDSSLDDVDVEMCIRGKRNHYWGGPMSFPDSLDKPARSILARTSRSTRQTIVIHDSRGPSPVYRTPTIRENACLQGFPITYQFWGESPNSRSILIGNAVPPPLARGLALEIRKHMGLSDNPRIKVTVPLELAPVPSVVGRGPRHRFLISRPYRRFIPGTIRYECRVDLDNRGVKPNLHPVGSCKHLVRWEANLALGYARDYVVFRINFPLACQIALMVARRGGDAARRTLADVVVAAATEFGREVPDASTLQAVWARKAPLPRGPDWIVEEIGRICTAGLAKTGIRDSGFEIRASECMSLLRESKLSSGKDSRRAKWKKQQIGFYASCCLVATSIASAFANQGVTWMRQNWNQAYKGAPLNILDDSSVSPSGLGAQQVVDAFSRLQDNTFQEFQSGPDEGGSKTQTDLLVI